MGEGNKRLSKRDQGSGLLDYVEGGYLPEGLCNYLALLGWGIAADRDVFSMQEMAEAFDVRRVNPNPARFDRKKLDAINSSHMRMLSVEEMEGRLLPFLQEADLVDEPPTQEQQLKVTEGTVLIHDRVGTLSEGADMLAFLFLDEVVYDEADVVKLLDESGRGVVAAARDALEALGAWDTATIEEALRAKLIEEMGLKPRVAFGPVRVAITGRRISPPLFESMELLGRETSLARLADCAG
jgi:glutamyl-tRNA synthetase